MSLSELVRKMEQEGADINFDEELMEFRILQVIPEARGWMNTKYYRMLAIATKLLGIRHALELGTFFGAGALALNKYGTKVTTCDVEYKLTDGSILAKRDIELVVLRHGDEVTRQRWSEYGLIFVDIGMHDGDYEAEIHRQLSEQYNGIVFYDDINYNAKMRSLWDSIEQEKVETDWHQDGAYHNGAPAGFGVVLYGTGVAEEVE